MKKILLGLFLFTGIVSTFAGGKKENSENTLTSNVETQESGDENLLRSYGCKATAYVQNSETGEWEPYRSFSICCFDTPEQACAAAQSELEDQLGIGN
ncbi:hypothetical protein [uncultured Chryseobacterium sp.]|uniref:hypothetical protein n=1 Tax=uncultured Chryseobacterium sp. TaxID=259322 RepID=UPI0025D2BD7D|nr:hypothetical protein [uncultured Chryseobacterium sp.]